MLEILLWLDRFDLDGKQITARRLSHLVENNQMPLRTAHAVRYCEHYKGHPTLSIDTLIGEEDEPHETETELDLETDADVQKAVSYLCSCFVPSFLVWGHHARTLYTCPDRRAIITSPPLIDNLELRGCDFNSGEENTLSETLRVRTFQSLSLYSNIPAWQVTDKLLESLRLSGCNSFFEELYFANADEKSDGTEEGILSFCFTLDDDLPMPDCRFLKIVHVNITPAFFKKLVQASKSSRLTCGVQLRLWLEGPPFDVGNLDIGVTPSRILVPEGPHEYRYNIDHGNGTQLDIHFRLSEGVTWDVTVRHEKKDREEPHDDSVESEPEEDQHERAAPKA
ncbi:hypothetical protein AAVH_11229 [Aphelenchoides avenae]|nr:hypothetical protein AAVH_11229 [Aphelenchus avenae]